MKNNKLPRIVLIIVIIMINFNLVYASENSSGQIDFLTIRHNNNKLIQVDIDEYLSAKYSGNKELLDFLSMGTSYLDVYSVISGTKHIVLEQYLSRFYYDLENNPKKYRINAINNAKRLELSEYTSEVIGFSEEVDHRLSELQLGIFNADIVGESAIIKIPYSQLNNSVKNFKVNFTQPVEILKINGKLLNDESMKPILDKFIRSGYNIGDLNSSYSFVFDDFYKYSMIYDFSRNISITIQNEIGYIKNIQLTFDIKR